MPDFARHQTPEYVEANYEPEPPSDPRAYVPEGVRESLNAAYVRAGLKHPCGSCSGAFWDLAKRDEHAARCSDA